MRELFFLDMRFVSPWSSFRILGYRIYNMFIDVDQYTYPIFP